MSAYNFQAQFEGALISGAKGTTIRADRKDRRVPKVAEVFDAYVGMRTKNCRRLFRSTITRVQRFELFEDPYTGGLFSIWRDGKKLGPGAADKLAIRDCAR
jgi:hypothetical protein